MWGLVYVGDIHKLTIIKDEEKSQYTKKGFWRGPASSSGCVVADVGAVSWSTAAYRGMD